MAFKNRCRALTLEKQCIFGPSAETKELPGRKAYREETDTAPKSAFKGR